MPQLPLLPMSLKLFFQSFHFFFLLFEVALDIAPSETPLPAYLEASDRAEVGVLTHCTLCLAENLSNLFCGQ